jgi:NAD(P)-dependent dehydrogenase (short-subunit alcohol dehydrogenase family)
MNKGNALVTGAADRLGKAMALHLADLGYNIVVHYMSSATAAEDVVSLIKKKGRSAVCLQADLLNQSVVKNLIPEAVKKINGNLSILINNASIFEYDTLDTATDESWKKHIGSNLQAPFFLTQEFARQAPDFDVDENNEPLARSVVINMIDQRVRKLNPEFMTYTIAKMGLWAFTQTAAQALAPKVRVNAIGPGPTLKGIKQSSENFLKQRSETILGRGSNSKDIVKALEYIVESPAVTGQIFCVDGGQHLNWRTADIMGTEF